MTSKLTESAIEDLAIERLEALGYGYVHGSLIAPDGDAPERSRWDQVIKACFRGPFMARPP